MYDPTISSVAPMACLPDLLDDLEALAPLLHHLADAYASATTDEVSR